MGRDKPRKAKRSSKSTKVAKRKAVRVKEEDAKSTSPPSDVGFYGVQGDGTAPPSPGSKPVPLFQVSRLNRDMASEEATPPKRRAILNPTNGDADENGEPQDPQDHLRELSARALNGMTSTDFRDRMLSSLRTYKAMSTLDAGTRPVFQPYLRRNLLYHMAFADRPTPPYTFGEGEPPLVWPRRPRVHVVCKDVEERQRHLSELIEALMMRSSIEEEIKGREEFRNFRFSIKTLAEFRRTKNVQVLYRSVAYRRSLRARGLAVPSTTESHPVYVNGNSNLDSALCQSPLLEDTATLSFRMVCHHLLEGERLAKVQVYTVQQKGEIFSRAERLPSATFTVSVNVPVQPVSIDVPTIVSDCDLRIYVLVRVDVTTNMKGIHVVGHHLRHLPNRVLRADNVNHDDPVSFEVSHCCNSLFFNQKSILFVRSHREETIPLVVQEIFMRELAICRKLTFLQLR
ncbi:hypothetical protein KIN20_038319 [Parelaphostrongylus tenuis]|uniref:Uncharacterized protein n=1 Tax=Parelaphostrongylus tenuis TaxID=148309 RepID=A0AAD5WMG3_PARTN|nr:hypothetical protein KIN20_038319 [Parelaphostrongylus tenuis]